MAKCVECEREVDTFKLSDGVDICTQCDNLNAFGCNRCDKDIKASEYYRNDGVCDTCMSDIKSNVCVVCKCESSKDLDEDGWCPSCTDKQKNNPLNLYLHDMDKYIEYENKYLK